MKHSVAGTYGRKDERVLVLLPESRDAGSVPRVLEKIGVAWVLCATPEEACAEIENGAGALLIEENILSRTKECLLPVLERQPAWSELPIMVLLRPGPETRASRDFLFLPGEVTLIERPIRVNTLVAIIRSALRSRRRQYLVRDQLQALDASETRYRTLFDSIDEGFCIVEVIFDENDRPVDYRLLEINPSFEKHTGLTNAQGRRMRELVPEHDEHWFEIYGRVALTGKPVRFQNRAERMNRWFDVYAFPFGRPEDRQIAVVFNDITDRTRAERELRQAKDELEIRIRERTEDLSRALLKLRTETEERLQGVEELRRKDQLLMQQGRMAAMGEMIGFIAHQWRQPLNALGLMIQETPIRYKMGDLNQEYLENNTSAAMRVLRQMSQTIDDFTNFFKSDKQEVLFSIEEILVNTMKLIQSSFRDSQVIIEIDAEQAVVAKGYPNEFSQVLLNILMNAKDILLEREVEKPKIAIRIFREDNKVVTTITDNAGGVPEETIERIFEPYFTTKGPKGTGIGLYISKIIIEKNMGGRLSVHNVAGGAEFRIEV